MKQTLIVAMFVVVSPSLAAAETALVEADGLVVLGDCVKQFDDAPVNHRLLGVAGEALDVCLFEARVALDAEMRLIRDFRVMPVPIEAGTDGLGRAVSVLSTVAWEGAEVSMALSAIEHTLRWGPLWLEEDPIVRLRAAVGSLEIAREVLAAPM